MMNRRTFMRAISAAVVAGPLAVVSAKPETAIKALPQIMSVLDIRNLALDGRPRCSDNLILIVSTESMARIWRELNEPLGLYDPSETTLMVLVNGFYCVDGEALGHPPPHGFKYMMWKDDALGLWREAWKKQHGKSWQGFRNWRYK